MGFTFWIFIRNADWICEKILPLIVMQFFFIDYPIALQRVIFYKNIILTFCVFLDFFGNFTVAVAVKCLVEKWYFTSTDGKGLKSDRNLNSHETLSRFISDRQHSYSVNRTYMTNLGSLNKIRTENRSISIYSFTNNQKSVISYFLLLFTLFFYATSFSCSEF